MTQRRKRRAQRPPRRDRASAPPFREDEWQRGLNRLADQLGYPSDSKARDLRHLREACTHRTFAHEYNQSRGARAHAPLSDNQRLEFLGDAMLGLSVAQDVMRRRPDATEGDLSSIRAHLINAERLAEVAVEAGLESHLRTGRGEVNMGETARAARLSDLTEAVIGALYLDLGWEATHAWIWRMLDPHYQALSERGETLDPKTALQHLTHQRFQEAPTYQHEHIEAEHGQSQRYQARAILGGSEIGRGRGATKKAAHFAAARDALERLRRE